MREAALCVMRLPAFWLLDLLDMFVTPFHVEVMVEPLHRRRSLLDVALSKHSLAGHDMQPMHARSPKSSDAHHARLLQKWSRDHRLLFQNVFLINFSTAFAAA